MGKSRAEPIEDFRDALALYQQISKLDYNLSFAQILRDTDHRRRAHRVRHLTGVAMKFDFSHPVPERSGEISHRRKIDQNLLDATKADHWALQALRAYPNRQRGESTKGVALRLHRETLLARAFIQSLHEYICKDGPTRKEVQRILAQIGLKEFAGLATPKGLIKVGAGGLYGYLLGILGLPAVGVAIATVVLCSLGMDAVCRSSKETTDTSKEAIASRTNRSTRPNPQKRKSRRASAMLSKKRARRPTDA